MTSQKIKKPARRVELKPTIVHVNQLIIRSNAKRGENNPPLSVRRGSDVERAHQIEIAGPCRIVYSPDKPLKCGAKVWIETFAEVATK